MVIYAPDWFRDFVADKFYSGMAIPLAVGAIAIPHALRLLEKERREYREQQCPGSTVEPRIRLWSVMLEGFALYGALYCTAVSTALDMDSLEQGYTVRMDRSDARLYTTFGAWGPVGVWVAAMVGYTWLRFVPYVQEWWGQRKSVQQSSKHD